MNILGNSPHCWSLHCLCPIHFLFANAVYLPLIPPGPDTGWQIRTTQAVRRGKGDGGWGGGGGGSSRGREKDQGREGESETFSWEKINIRSHLILLLPLLHPLPTSPSSPYLNVKPIVACGFYIFYHIMSFISCIGAAVKLFRVTALIRHTDSP